MTLPQPAHLCTRKYKQKHPLCYNQGLTDWAHYGSQGFSMAYQFHFKQDGDLQSQAQIRLSKDKLRTDILSGDGRWQMMDGRWQMKDGR